MSTETLREAAALMRKQAEAASHVPPAPARVGIDREGTCDGCASQRRLVASYPEPDSEPWLCAECAADADFAASWHPEAALAVALLLENEANAIERADAFAETYGDFGITPVPYNHARRTLLLAVARAYLGGAS